MYVIKLIFRFIMKEREREKKLKLDKICIFFKCVVYVFSDSDNRLWNM